MQKFKKLNVWVKSMDLAEEVYRATTDFPDHEKFGLRSQIRRAASSVALNIAEGSGSSSDKEFARFLGISLMSNYEVMCAIELAERLKYFSDEESTVLFNHCDEVAAMISGLKKKLFADSCKLKAES